MKTKSLLFFLLFAAFNFSSCKKDETKQVEELGYGSYFGMCIGYCSTNISIGSSKIVFSKQKNGTAPDTKTCTKAITEDEIAELKKLVNISEFKELGEVIGCPDCADGGAEWITLKLDGQIKKVTFEYGKVPEQLSALVTKLREIKGGFQDCN